MKKSVKIVLGVSLIALFSAGVFFVCDMNVKKNTKNDVVINEVSDYSADNLIDLALQEIDGQYIESVTKKELDFIYKDMFMTDMPHIFINKIPDDFVVETEDDKTLFMKLMTPQLLRANEKVLRERKALILLDEKIKKNQKWNEKETSFFEMIAKKYDVLHINDQKEQLIELLVRVDIVPVSLAMAVSIWTTNWGQRDKQSPFFEHAWNEQTLYVPIKFENLHEATDSFFLQLNSRSDLQGFRTSRQHLRRFRENAIGEFGWDLVHHIRLYQHNIPSFPDQIDRVYSLGYISELDNACFKNKCELTK